MKWNVLWQLPYYIHDLEKQLRVDMYKEYFSARENPYIVHYAGSIKPWINIDVPMAEIWWKYARLTPFYEEFVLRLCEGQTRSLIKKINHLSQYKLRYWKYRIFANFVWGKKREKYQDKKNEYKAKINEIKKILKD